MSKFHTFQTITLLTCPKKSDNSLLVLDSISLAHLQVFNVLGRAKTLKKLKQNMMTSRSHRGH